MRGNPGFFRGGGNDPSHGVMGLMEAKLNGYFERNQVQWSNKYGAWFDEDNN